MTETTRRRESTADPILYVAFELSQATWRLAMGTGRGDGVRHYTVDAGDLGALLEKVRRARRSWGLPDDTRVASGYEAGRDGFWVHRWLTTQGWTNVVLDPASIEQDRRAKHAKTDRLDAERLLELLIAGGAGRKRLRVVRVPSETEEDARHPDRELGSAKAVRTAITNRIRGLLCTQGVRHWSGEIPAEGWRAWDGTPLRSGLAARLTREVAALEAVAQRIAALERARRVALRAQETAATQQMAQLMSLVGIGVNGASRLVLEFFAWRGFQNGRQIGALAGLTPTPFGSGTIHREQGISKAGNAAVRALAIELAWGWVRFQPQSALTRWFLHRFGAGGARQRRIGIVALARKLLIALWRFLTTGVVPDGAIVKAVA